MISIHGIQHRIEHEADLSEILSDVLKRIKELPAEKQVELRRLAATDIDTVLWRPTPGPQLDAYNCKADILLYGGQAGGGKSEIILGLAFTAHKNSLILRRQYTDLSALTERSITINRTRKGYNGSIPPKLKTGDGRLIEFGACQRVGDEENFQGRAHSLLAFDEAVQFTESQVRFLMTWVRSTDPNERCRIVLASNPPVGAEGEWIIPFFGPWLDETHHNPAAPGELRWYVTQDGKDREVDGPEPVMVNGQALRPMSRTFIPAKWTDNPFLTTDYQAKLDSLQEPYRSAFRDGNFMLARRDAPQQVIPTAWVREAQARWTPNPPSGVPMCALGVDVAGGPGGEDETTIAIRHDTWFAPIVAVPGTRTPTGPDVAGLIVTHRRDAAVIILDLGGGYGGSAYDHLRGNLFANETGTPPVFGYKGVESSNGRTIDNQFGFTNRRSETYWRFREALDPSQPGGSQIALPPDPRLVADLTAPTFEITQRGIKIELKEDVVKKLRRSPDRGDAVVICWSEGQKALTHGVIWGKAHNNLINFPSVRHHREAQRQFTVRR